MNLKYHVYAKRISGVLSDSAKIQERGIGSFFYSKEGRAHLRAEATSVARGFLGYDIMLCPTLKGSLEVHMIPSKHFKKQ